MSTILDDEFGGSGAVTSHTSDSGHTWTDNSDTFFFDGGTAGDASHLILAGGACIDNTTSGSPFPSVASNASIPANCFVEAHVVGTNTQATQIVLGFRYNASTGAGFFLLLGGGATGKVGIGLQAWLGGGDPGDAYPTASDISVANNLDFVVRVEASGTSLVLKFDGVTVPTPSGWNAAYVTAAGTVGFAISSSGAGHSGDATLDYIHAGSLDSAFWTDFVQSQEFVS